MTQFRPSRKLWQKIIYICIYRFFVGHFDIYLYFFRGGVKTTTYHQRCGDAKAPLESFRLSQILSFGGLVVAEDSDGEDVALFEDIIRVEKKFYGDWSKETRQLLADGDALAAYKRRAFDLYRQRFAPEALLRRVDAWNERGAPDDWQDS